MGCGVDEERTMKRSSREARRYARTYSAGGKKRFLWGAVPLATELKVRQLMDKSKLLWFSDKLWGRLTCIARLVCEKISNLW